ncbi:Beta-glucanase [Sphaceloma murrayae]|uniref:Beta-glucanase n=1 Tax=Sphaceloma murrayae TaxID=2082308 RepID=A0A2K1QKN9_9PEZI|nr:Beta-glucanase [Sphaceloma murrayae]
MSIALLGATALLTGLSLAQAVSPPAKWTGKGYNIAGVGTFNTFFEVDFSKLTAFPSSLDISTNTVAAGRAPYARTFKKSNIQLNQGESVSLLVQPVIEDGSIPSGEFSTNVDDILYGSVRTVARASASSGTCHGFFSYLNDNQETDIEILTKDLSKVWFTNQALEPGTDETSTSSPAPKTIASAFHEYRIDWLPKRTVFYIDGVRKAELTSNVPTEPTSWLWNNWANGNPSWSGAAPTNVSDLRIKSITAYWNRTSVAVAEPPSGLNSTTSSTVASTVKPSASSGAATLKPTTMAVTTKKGKTSSTTAKRTTTRKVKPKTTKKAIKARTTTKKGKGGKTTAKGGRATEKPAIRTVSS